MAHIFDEFTQEESSARTHYKGSGLGMAISKKYVDMMGGRIFVESEKGKGSVFTVELPLELTEDSRLQKQNHSDADKELETYKKLLEEEANREQLPKKKVIPYSVLDAVPLLGKGVMTGLVPVLERYNIVVDYNR